MIVIITTKTIVVVGGGGDFQQDISTDYPGKGWVVASAIDILCDECKGANVTILSPWLHVPTVELPLRRTTLHVLPDSGDFNILSLVSIHFTYRNMIIHFSLLGLLFYSK